MCFEFKTNAEACLCGAHVSDKLGWYEKRTISSEPTYTVGTRHETFYLVYITIKQPQTIENGTT